ncbi:alpha/beta hydrolase [Jannaschia ovalis]|uniref:Alpha/beta hydrolase n=1 Tax=Jannaschia ovalis TaxID=3038773 RepID=A0ABY8LF39_9RHOB|nr:alpha/beta fold hydrolase [Jannaschia sp. GRR-S6-38]WGH78779.1 alpha/beta hydrolase [Jannaschia sp. GRR-S6-38]
MTMLLRGLLALVMGLGVALAGLWAAGPYEPVDTEIAFDASAMPADLEGWLADAEAQVAGLDPEAAKRILWAGAPGERTDLALIYVHGFSATGWELRPVPDRLGEMLGANVFITRLTGHGRDGAALAQARAGDWLEDMAEAMEIGRRLGERVVVMGTSTGGTLAAILAADPALEPQRAALTGLILVSPNFRVANPAGALLSWPAARAWVPLVAGETRSFAPLNDRHGRHWTTEYPSVALLPMQAALDHARALDFAAAQVPALFWFAPADGVVDHAATESVAAAWGGPATVSRVTVPAGDDPLAHVIAGEILSPGGTPAAIVAMADWLRGL